MTDKERKDFLKGLKEYKKEVTSSREEARAFLVRLGVFTKKGKLTKPYKNLCIPEGRG